ncbi:acyl-CoA dehydrogenase family protein [Aquincola sp. S2]|uniref:Acyl-CoA dehydrogenase family protein n=1 Tax=Pseudaquabacterium terrae TaxID=2732868 RepID=A0ABX2ETD0_9BURK|nr:acyl-CoA dehydrogenase [Aquabacterium terrae]NRF72000.1 acyl-CoA dehydrogenase family protein [Aquabacterium terrae]
MQFELTEDQALLRDSVERCLDETYTFEARRGIVAAGGFDAAQWRRFGAMGWLGTALPDALGGIDGGAEELALLHERLGRALVVEPVASIATLAAQIVRHADPARARELLPALSAGDRLLVAAHHEAGAAGRLARVATRAERVPGGVRLSGHKVLLPGGPQAESFVVTAREGGGHDDERGLSLFLVPAQAAGLHRHDYRLIDGSTACDLQLDGLLLDTTARLGAPNEAFAALDDAHALATVAAIAEALGVMDRALHTTRDYLLERRQFGVAIASFQALRHRLADMAIAVEQSHAMLQQALHALHEPDRAQRRRALALAKALAGRNGRFVGAQAIQLHGGIGMTDEYQIGHCFKRLMVLDQWLGDAETLWGAAAGVA